MHTVNLKKIIIYMLIFLISYTYSQEQQSKKVSAKLIDNLIYNTDYMAHKSKDGYLIYGDKVYVSLEEVCTIFKHAYNLDSNIIRFSDINTEQEIDETLTNTYYKHAVIEDINLAERVLTLTTQEVGQSNQTITLTLNQNTKIQHELLDSIFPLEVLKKGMHVTVSTQIGKIENGHNVAMTIVIEEIDEMGGLTPNLKDVMITEVNKEKQYLTVKLQTPYNGINEIVIHVDHHTNIKYLNNKEATLDVLVSGMYVDIKTNSVLTDSIPPHTIGLEIIINK